MAGSGGVRYEHSGRTERKTPAASLPQVHEGKVQNRSDQRRRRRAINRPDTRHTRVPGVGTEVTTMLSTCTIAAEAAAPCRRLAAASAVGSRVIEVQV